MDIHGFGDASTEEPQAMYVPGGEDSGMGDDGYGSGGGLDDSSDSGDGGSITLEAGGYSGEFEATIDIDGDGDNDSALVDTGDGHQVGITDSDGDGTADHAVLLDESGQVVDAAVYDEDSGEWSQDESGDYTEASTEPTSDDPDGGSGADYDDAGGSIDTADTGSMTEITVDQGDGSGARPVNATLDLDGDGQGDTAVVESGDGTRIAVTDTDRDGEADAAALLDETGHVIDTAHVDPTTGEWVHGPGADNPYEGYETVASPDGDTGHSSTASTGDADVTGAPSGASQQITVEAGGQVNQVEATVDVDRDGMSETAVVQGSDGTQIAFSDTDGDGEADRAAVFDPQGNLVGTATFDPSTGEWQDDPAGSSV